MSMTDNPETGPNGALADEEVAARVEALGQRLQEVRGAIGEVIFGQETVIERTLITLIAGGHCLLVGVPGLAKTRLVETLGTVFGLEDKRVQCTPDLMPAAAPSASSRGRSSASFSWPTKSTAPARAPSRPCFRPCRNTA
jgi:MoxR-like ATPase